MTIDEELTKLVRTISGDDNAKFYPEGYVKRFKELGLKLIEEAAPGKLKGDEPDIKHTDNADDVMFGFNEAIDQFKSNLADRLK